MPDDHAAIRALVKRIRNETGERVPDVDPRGPGAGAKVVMLMLTPGPAPGGAQMTNVLSPTTNTDQSAINLRRLMSEAGLSERVCVFWNAVPWALERRRDPTDGELRRGVAYLQEFLTLVHRPKVVVALGQVAQRACRIGGIEAIETPSPSPLSVAPPGAQPNSKSERWLRVRNGLRKAASLADR